MDLERNNAKQTWTIEKRQNSLVWYKTQSIKKEMKTDASHTGLRVKLFQQKNPMDCSLKRVVWVTQQNVTSPEI